MVAPRLVPLAFLALLASGCTAPEDEGIPMEQWAETAADRLKADQGPDGDLRRIDGHASLHMDLEDMQMDMEMGVDTQFHTGDAMSVVVAFERMAIDGEAFDGMEPFQITILCTPGEVTMWSDGMPGGGAMRNTTANDAGGCLGEGVDAERLAGSFARLAGDDQSGIAQWGMLGMPSEEEETYTLVSETVEGDAVLAEYEVAAGEGMQVHVEARIEEGRIVKETGIFEVMGAEVSMTMLYEYGERTAAPGF